MFSLSFVCAQSGHEIHRRWAVLTDPAAPNLVCGYLKFSAAVIGPGDKPVVHDAAEDAKRERESGDDTSQALMPATVAQAPAFLVVDMHKVGEWIGGRVGGCVCGWVGGW
jgi:hypothetical protein